MVRMRQGSRSTDLVVSPQQSIIDRRGLRYFFLRAAHRSKGRARRPTTLGRAIQCLTEERDDSKTGDDRGGFSAWPVFGQTRG